MASSQQRVEILSTVDPSRICCIEGPNVISLQSAEVRLAVSKGQPLFTMGLPMTALSLGYILSLPRGPSTNTDFFIHAKNIVWSTKDKSSKNFM